MSDSQSTTTLQFLGGTGTVSGSRFLVDTPRARVLVDCGLYQGLKELRERNWHPFPVDPKSLDAVLLTHAHIDHSGYIPALERLGFRGRVFATARTVDLCGIVLPDSARLHEEEAAYANRKGFSKHSPALSLFTQEETERVLARFHAVPVREPISVADGVTAVFRPAGHILGSASIHLEVAGPVTRSLLVSGDLGRTDHPLLLPPDPPPTVDALLVESTYGDRDHDEWDAIDQLASAVARTAKRGGVAVIPAFAVDRTEVVLFHLKRMMEAGRIPRIPVFVDSPMALAALQVYRKAIAAGDPEIRPELRGATDPFDIGELIEARHVSASKAINERSGPAIVVSASGMATGGRVLHHLANRLPDPRNSVILVGFQALRTRGRLLLEGARSLKMLGRYTPVRAEIVNCSGLSVHADRAGILAWLRQSERSPATTYVVHGEPVAAESLCAAIDTELDWTSVVPRHLERVRVEDGG